MEASSTPARPARPDADRRDRHHVGLERDAERADHFGILHARAHHPAERRAVDQEPGERDGDCRDHEHHEAVLRIDEVTEEELPAQEVGHRVGQRRGAEDHAQALLGDHREAEGQQQREDRVGAIEPAEQQPLDQDAEQADQDRRGDECRGETDMGREHDGEIGPERIECAVRQIDDAAEREDQREPERDQQVVDAESRPLRTCSRMKISCTLCSERARARSTLPLAGRESG